MLILILGLVIFLGVHLIPTLPETRGSLIARMGEGGYKGFFSLASFMGLGLIVWGFVLYRAGGYVPVWEPPRFMNHITMLLMLPAIILLAASKFPGKIKAVVKHPMLAGIKFWALGHLLANGDLGSIVLFGSFLAFGVYDRISIKRRVGLASISSDWCRNDVLAIVVGLAVYLAIVFFLHPVLFGVPVLPPR